ncbi:MAG TPA: PaaI family thioesterase [Sphingobium sp.]|uniref:PaaI family thioesterase n=1 Tax=Sphingobium sp. TaxID=1912891 RepID=UPI002ED0558C
MSDIQSAPGAYNSVTTLTPVMTLTDLGRFLDRAFPVEARAALGELVSIHPGRVRLRLDPKEEMLRPGAIVSGPVMMGLIDVAAYAAVLAHIGPEPMAVTHNLNTTFLRQAGRSELIADAVLLRLASVDVRLWQGSEDRLIAQATVGYALPGKGEAA